MTESGAALADWVQVAPPDGVDDNALFGSAFGAVARQLSESELLPDKFDEEPPATSDAQRIEELEAKWSAMTAARAEATPAEARHAARPPSRRRWIAALLALVVGMMAAEGGVRVHRSCVRARAARREAALRTERAALASKPGVGGALDAVSVWVREKGAMHAALSAGLGLAGLAIGVPCVPGVTDNLVIGAVGAVLPQLGWPLKAPGDEAE